MARILIVDDEKNLLEVLSHQLTGLGHTINTAGGIREAAASIKTEQPDIVLTDLKMPDGTGTDLLQNLQETHDRPAFIIMTAYASIDSSVRAMKMGAEDYITKPVNIDELDLLIRRIEEQSKLRRENASLRRKLNEVITFEDIPGQAPAFLESITIARKAAASDFPVLITGESGTGKELIARAIHYSGNRRDNSFVAHNCASLNSALFESELFGYKKGAFTGAERDREGLIARAEGGTLFLDEIGELPDPLQAKLLRLLENSTYRRLGESEERRSNLRLICATNKNLPAHISANTFREDFFYRINTLSVHLPPLRQRAEDIRMLAQLFHREIDPEGKTTLSEAFLIDLERYTFPGNIRELKNIIHKAVVLTEGEVTDPQLPEAAELPDSELHTISANTVIPDFSRESFDLNAHRDAIINRTLEHFSGNITKTASFLEMPRHKLIYILKKKPL